MAFTSSLVARKQGSKELTSKWPNYQDPLAIGMTRWMVRLHMYADLPHIYKVILSRVINN